MGRGNVCVFGKYEGLYYVDRGYLDYYVPNDGEAYEGLFLEEMELDEFASYTYSEAISSAYYEDFVNEFIHLFTHRFKSFMKTGNDYGKILENELFEIEIEDNEWSYAVKLIQKECWYDNHLEGLQKKHSGSYLNGIKYTLLDMFPSIGAYSGAWTSRTITREDIGIQK